MNTQPLDLTRFDPPALSAREEQDIADAEHRLAEQRHRVTQVIYCTCKDWDESDFLQLAACALEQFVHPKMRRRELYEAFEVIDRAARNDRQRNWEGK